MKFIRFTDLRSRLFFVFLLASIPLLILMLVFHFEQQRQAIAAVQNSALVLTRLIAKTQSQVVSSSSQLIKGLRNLPEIRNYSEQPQNCQQVLASLLREFPQYANFSVADPDGNFICNAIELSAPVNIKDREYFKRALASKQFTIGEFISGRVTRKQVLPLSIAITDDAGQITGVLVSGIDLSWLNAQDFEAKLPPDSVLTIIDHRGVVLARYPDPEKWVGVSVENKPLFAMIQQHIEGVEDSIGLDDVKRLYAFTPIQYASNDVIYVSLGIPLDVAYAELGTLQSRTLLEIIFVGVIALCVTWFGTKLLVLRPLDKVVEAANQLASGNMAVRSGPPYSADRLGQLAIAFDKMAEVLDKRTQELQEAESRYRTLVEQIPAAIYLIDLEPGVSVLYVSPQVESMLGYPRAEWLTSLRLWLCSVHPEDRKTVKSALINSRRTGQPFSIKYRALHKKGFYIWLRNEAVLFKDQEGKSTKVQGLLTNIDERVQAEEAQRIAELLSVELEQEKQLAEMKDRFVSVVSHEFRTPLATILSSASLLEIASDRMTDEKKLWHYKKLQQTVRNMVVLLEEVLTFNKATAGKISLNLAPINLEAFCREVIEEVETLTSHTHEIIFRVEGACTDALMDEKLLRQIINNLLTNAIKYSPQNTPVNFTLRCDDKLMQLCINDRGIGIPEADRPRLFQAFNRATNVGSIQGTGLGLAITDKAVKLHGGNIRFESEVGQGTTFIVELPLEPEL